MAVLATTSTVPATVAAKPSAGLTTRQLTLTCTVTVAIDHKAVCMSDSHSPADYNESEVPVAAAAGDVSCCRPAATAAAGAAANTLDAVTA